MPIKSVPHRSSSEKSVTNALSKHDSKMRRSRVDRAKTLASRDNDSKTHSARRDAENKPSENKDSAVKHISEKSGSARTLKGEKRKQRLLSTAIDTFLEFGYDGASLEKIIQVAGGSRSTIYTSYGNKKGLFLACLKSLIDEVYTAYENEYDENRSWEEELKIFGEVYLTAILSDKAVGTSRLIFSQTAKDPEIGKWYYREGAQLSYLCFAKVLENKLPLDFETLHGIALHYIELLKADLYHHRLSDPTLRIEAVDIRREVKMCSAIIASFIREKISSSTR